MPARRTKDGAQVARRLLALAAVYDGATRTEASKIGGVTLQIVRDWVVKFNAPGPDGLVDEKAPRQAEPLPSKCPRQLALQPLQILRGHPRPSLLRLEQARQHALENHVHRNARLGLEVITTIGISPLSPTSRTGSIPSASTRGPTNSGTASKMPSAASKTFVTSQVRGSALRSLRRSRAGAVEGAVWLSKQEDDGIVHQRAHDLHPAPHSRGDLAPKLCSQPPSPASAISPRALSSASVRRGPNATFS